MKFGTSLAHVAELPGKLRLDETAYKVVQAIYSSGANRRKAKERAGAECTPYSLRHTVGKWLRSQGVPPWEVAALLDHKMPGYNITEMCAGADPSQT
jgi:integrase